MNRKVWIHPNQDHVVLFHHNFYSERDLSGNKNKLQINPSYKNKYLQSIPTPYGKGLQLKNRPKTLTQPSLWIQSRYQKSLGYFGSGSLEIQTIFSVPQDIQYDPSKISLITQYSENGTPNPFELFIENKNLIFSVLGSSGKKKTASLYIGDLVGKFIRVKAEYSSKGYIQIVICEGCVFDDEELRSKKTITKNFYPKSTNYSWYFGNTPNALWRDNLVILEVLLSQSSSWLKPEKNYTSILHYTFNRKHFQEDITGNKNHMDIDQEYRKKGYISQVITSYGKSVRLKVPKDKKKSKRKCMWTGGIGYSGTGSFSIQVIFKVPKKITDTYSIPIITQYRVFKAGGVPFALFLSKNALLWGIWDGKKSRKFVMLPSKTFFKRFITVNAVYNDKEKFIELLVYHGVKPQQLTWEKLKISRDPNFLQAKTNLQSSCRPKVSGVNFFIGSRPDAEIDLGITFLEILISQTARWKKIVSTDNPVTKMNDSALVTFKNRFYLLGGRQAKNTKKGFTFLPTNLIYTSPNGKDWKLLGNAPWPPRFDMGAVIFKEQIYILGGKSTNGVLLNDVWSSPDGKTWKKKIHNTWCPRYDHGALSYKSKIWVFGGWIDKQRAKDDVWYSSDGKTWKQAPNIGFKPPRYCTSATYQNKIYLSGGDDGRGSGYRYNEIRIFDGVQWRRLVKQESVNQNDKIFSKRAHHKMLEHNGKLLLTGGYDNRAKTPNDTWIYVNDKYKNWIRIDVNSKLNMSEHHCLGVLNDRVFLIASSGVYVWE